MTCVFVSFRPPYLCPSEGHKHSVSIHNLINISKTFLRISPARNIAQNWILVRLFEYSSSFTSSILDDSATVKTGNYSFILTNVSKKSGLLFIKWTPCDFTTTRTFEIQNRKCLSLLWLYHSQFPALPIERTAIERSILVALRLARWMRTMSLNWRIQLLMAPFKRKVLSSTCCLLRCSSRFYLLNLWTRSLSVTIQMKGTEPYFLRGCLLFLRLGEGPPNFWCTLMKFLRCGY